MLDLSHEPRWDASPKVGEDPYLNSVMGAAGSRAQGNDYSARTRCHQHQALGEYGDPRPP